MKWGRGRGGSVRHSGWCPVTLREWGPVFDDVGVRAAFVSSGVPFETVDFPILSILALSLNPTSLFFKT